MNTMSVPIAAPAKSDVSSALSVGWARTARKVGKGAMADKIEASTKTIDRALTQETLPELHTTFASLLADDGALDEVFALYGLERPRRKNAQAANDMVTVSCLSSVVTAFCEALKDGKRVHTETLDLADKVREVMPSLVALLDEANRIRGVAA